MIVTHAHMDHTGRIPKLVKEGFRGKIISTPPTKEIAAVLFDDAIGIMDVLIAHTAIAAELPLHTGR